MMQRTIKVATVLTVYGIETGLKTEHFLVQSQMVATVLTVYGIETLPLRQENTPKKPFSVATVLTVYGIET